MAILYWRRSGSVFMGVSTRPPETQTPCNSRSCIKSTKVPLGIEALFKVENFLHPALSGLHLFRSVLKGARRFMGSIFKLKTRSRAILSENDQRNVIPIPASAMVTLVGGDIDEDAFVKIRYGGKVLMMLAEDLRSAGEQWGKSV